MESIRLPDSERFATLVAVAETGSFRKAAEVRYLTPSTVHKQMRALEKQLGFPLFARSGRDIIVLAAAHELAGSASEALEASERLATRVNTMRTKTAHSLHLIAPPIHVARSIGVAVRKFEHDNDVNIRTTVKENDFFTDVSRVAAALKRHECDIAITLLEPEGMESVPLWQTSIVAVLPESDRGEHVSITDLDGQTVFALPSSGWSRRILDHMAAEANITMNVVTESLPELCISLAKAGMGIAVIADDNVIPDTAVPLVDLHGHQHSGVIRAHCYPETQSPLTQQFMAFLQQHHAN